jgi:iron complex transport system substrate-binding protein
MKRRVGCRKSLFLFLLVTIAAIATLACTNKTIYLKKERGSSLGERPSIATKIVKDAVREVEIPLHPKRVIVLDDHTYLDPVLALGIRPVGVISCEPDCNEAFRGIPFEFVANIPPVGTLVRPSLEKIFSLKPDIILAHQDNKDAYSLLSAIAPTVMIDYDSVMDFKERLQYFAQLLGRHEQFKKLLSQYEARIQQLRQELGKKLGEKLKALTVSIIYFQSSQIYVSNLDAIPHSQIVRDAGLQLAPAYSKRKASWSTLSIEALPEYDSNYLFIITDDESLSFLKQPIWSTLKAVQSNRVYAVRWDVGGPIGANRIIDDLYKYIVNTP